MGKTLEERRKYQREYMREYNMKYPEKNRANVNKWRTEHPNKAFDTRLRARFGIGEQQYLSMIAEQGNKCAICNAEKPDGRGRRWYVDHCHETNKVRGLLCVHCNLVLGHAKDNPARLRIAADYLERKY